MENLNAPGLRTDARCVLATSLCNFWHKEVKNVFFLMYVFFI